MASSEGTGLGRILCLFRLIRTTSCSNLNQFLTWNKEFEFDPSNQPQDSPPRWTGSLNLNSHCGPVYALYFDNTPKKDGNWVFGSLSSPRPHVLRAGGQATKDQSCCDFQLSASNIGTSIGRSHFSIDVAPRIEVAAPVIPRLNCLGSSIDIRYFRDPDKTIPLYPGDNALLNEPVTITCGPLQLEVWSPTLTGKEMVEQGIVASDFQREVVNEPPGFFPTIRSEADTRYDNSRVGLDSGNFYVCFEEKVLPTTSVIPSCVVRSGPLKLSAIVPQAARNWIGSLMYKLEEFTRACDNAEFIQHPNILAIREIAAFRGATYKTNFAEVPWLITELLEQATTLEDYIRPGRPFELQQRYDIIAQLASGLDYLQYKGLFHMELLPENIIITETEPGKPTAKIAKLEALNPLAADRIFEDRGDNLTVYSAQEILNPPYRYYSYPAAAYRLGVIALRMLTPYDSNMKSYDDKVRYNSEAYSVWAEKVVLPSLKRAPKRTVTLINGLLHTNLHKRWTLGKCYREVAIPSALCAFKLRGSSSDSSRPLKRKRDSPAGISHRGPTPNNRTPHPSVGQRSLSVTPRSTPDIGASSLKRPRGTRLQLAHISEEDELAGATGLPAANITPTRAPERPEDNLQEDDDLPDTLPWGSATHEANEIEGMVHENRSRQPVSGDVENRVLLWRDRIFDSEDSDENPDGRPCH
ncbi:kinase-like domain-containing protein [Xylaria venustula]|nr:kinase-like domain-containing protein [Xylaria venustula]